MVQGFENAINGLIHVNVFVAPGLDDQADGVVHGLHSDLASREVEQIGEVV